MPHAPTPRHTILCVDGDAESRLLLQELLCDHTLTFADTAFDALRLINGTAFNGFITEYWLPDFSGTALCREIRKADSHAPIVICTGSAREKDRASGLRAGANAYISKPLDPGGFRLQLSQLLATALHQSLSAMVPMEAAIRSELQKQIRFNATAVDATRLTTASSERLAKARACEAFTGAGGSRVYFESWWPQLFSNAQFELNLQRDPDENS